MWRHLSILALLISVAGCSSSKGEKSAEASSGTNAKSKKTDPPKPALPPDPRDDYQLHRDLLKESSRAELRVGGPFIDFGTADQHKYTRGGWGSGWEESNSKDTSAALIKEGPARLNYYLVGSPKSVVFRARSTEGSQEVGVIMSSKEVGKVNVGDEWGVHEVELGELAPGRRRLELAAKGLEVDWLWLSGADSKKAPAALKRTAPHKLDGRIRRAFRAPQSLSYSFYLHPPEGAKLIADLGSTAATDFVVRVQEVEGASSEVFRQTATESWKTAIVDLSAYAGKAIRLELATEGEEGDAGWGEPGIYVNKMEAPAPSKFKNAKNLVLVVMDTTRADQFETFTADNGTHTPVYDAWSKRSTSFVRAYNNSNWTKPSMASMFSGLYAMTHTATKPASILPEGIELISEHLQKQGLKTQGLTANPVVSEKFGFERGWDGFEVTYEADANAQAMYTKAAKWVEDNGEEPFFLYVQTIEPHTTYRVPREYWSRYYKKGSYSGPIGQEFTRDDQKKVNDRVLKLSDNDVDWIRSLYRGEVTYQDEQIGILLDKLEELGRLDDTIVVITNDHGEELYDHGSFGHGWQLDDFMIRAPLVIHYPPVFPEGTVVDALVEHVDLAPTLLEAMGLPPMKATEGQSFLPMLRNESEQLPRYALSTSDNGKRTVIVGNWKLIVSKSKGWKHLYDMRVDELKKNDMRKQAELAGRLCEVYMGESMATPHKLQRLEGGGMGQKFKAVEAELDEETRKELEALGYL